MSKPSDLGSLKIGSYILLPHSDQPSGEPCRIVEYDTSKPGKHGSAKARIVAQGIFDGQKRPHVGPVSMQIHIPLINKKVGQIISLNGDTVQVMDSETFETIDVSMILVLSITTQYSTFCPFCNFPLTSSSIILTSIVSNVSESIT